MFKKVLTGSMIVLMLCACVPSNISSILGDTTYTPGNAEVISALKEALSLGAESASKSLSASGGYYKNNAYKILLPPEADIIIKNISKVPGGEKLVEDVILRINTAAENAAADVVPIFSKAITNMTVNDGMNILLGDNTAATEYFRTTAGSDIKKLYSPKLNEALSEPVLGGISAEKSWQVLTTQYNKVAGTAAAKIAGMKTVNTSINDYVLEKAVDGLFSKVAEQEEQIRKQPFAYGSETLSKVFNYAKSR